MKIKIREAARRSDLATLYGKGVGKRGLALCSSAIAAAVLVVRIKAEGRRPRQSKMPRKNDARKCEEAHRRKRIKKFPANRGCHDKTCKSS